MAAFMFQWQSWVDATEMGHLLSGPFQKKFAKPQSRSVTKIFPEIDVCA